MAQLTIKDAGITVNVARETRSPSQKGFGAIGFVHLVPAITQRTTLYTSIESLASDFNSGDEPYQAGLAFYSQSPTPTDFIVIQSLQGTAAAAATATYTITGTAEANGDYQFDIDSVSYTVAVVNGDDETDIAAKIAVQINSGLTHDATSAAGIVTITDKVTGAAGNSVVITETATVTGVTSVIVQPSGGADATTSEAIADVLDAAVLENPDFYCVALDRNYRAFESEILDCAAWTEANERVFANTTNDTDVLDVANDTDIATQLQNLGYTRTFTMYSSVVTQYPDCAAFGILATTSFRGTNTLKTLKFKDAIGINSEPLTPNALNAVHEKSCNVLYETASIRMIDDGRMASPTRTWFDEIHGTDALTEEIRVRVFGALTRTSTKIPYTESGMATLKAEVSGALDQYVTNGFLASGVDEDGNYLDAYTVSSSPVALASTADKSARIAPDISFTARLAGSVHNITINGKLVLE